MDLGNISLGTHIKAAALAFVVFFIGVGLAWAVWPEWSPLERTLSQLGEWYRTQTSPIFFNSGCIFAGLLTMFGGLGKYIHEEGLSRISGIFFMTGGLCLMFVGIICGDNNAAHDITAILMFLNMGLATLLATIADWKNGYLFVPISGLVILIALLIQWMIIPNTEALSECMPITGMFLWTMVQVYKYHKIGEI